MTRRMAEPMALARVRWRTVADGGRASGPPLGSSYAPTVIFVMEGDEELIPNWPEAAEQFTARFDFLPNTAEGACLAKVDFLARDHVNDRVQAGARLLLMEGRRVVGEATIIERLPPE